MVARDSTDPDIKYLNSKDTQNYLVDIKENNFSLKGAVLHGEYLFVLTCENPPKLLCDKPTHHSYLANGKKVLAAGTLIFDRGALLKLTNNSGHYQPTDSEMLPAIKALYMASGKMLEIYESFSSSPPRAYLVKELINSANFAEAIFQSGTSETDPDEQRYGRELKKDLVEFYANIVSYPLFFQSKPASQNHS
ncbi:Uncharacterised protein [Legionella beliardensis]|uniref:Uncharacterized protein n=1 Tax=Legionella beliardensis TaxID=91822 RepID=A0A378HXK8_9GAMM|nr:hypothetical protein [Legionella beliardensis]STX27609.1 Uncharacterised protein [Legionella beliardensis]